MPKCKNCKNLKNGWCEKITDSPHTDIERECEHYQKMTNADKIRTMTNEELLAYIFGVSVGESACTLCTDDCGSCKHGDDECKDKMLHWLQSEAE